MSEVSCCVRRRTMSAISVCSVSLSSLRIADLAQNAFELEVPEFGQSLLERELDLGRHAASVKTSEKPTARARAASRKRQSSPQAKATAARARSASALQAKSPLQRAQLGALRTARAQEPCQTSFARIWRSWTVGLASLTASESVEALARRARAPALAVFTELVALGEARLATRAGKALCFNDAAASACRTPCSAGRT